MSFWHSNKQIVSADVHQEFCEGVSDQDKKGRKDSTPGPRDSQLFPSLPSLTPPHPSSIPSKVCSSSLGNRGVSHCSLRDLSTESAWSLA